MGPTVTDLDKTLFLALNHFSAPGIDPVMRFLSGWIPWILFILLAVLITMPVNWKSGRREFLIGLAMMAVTYLATELASVHLFKEVFMRLRPCHEPSLAGQVRLVANHCGGQYGFISSHTANSFGLAMISTLLVRRKWFTITVFIWALLISYSRIYLGVHYPGDVLGGILVGTMLGCIVYVMALKLRGKAGETGEG